MPSVTSFMNKPILAVLVLISMMHPGRADDRSFQANPIPAPLLEITNAEQQVWRWTNQKGITQPSDFLLALDQPSTTTKQITPDRGIAQGSNTAAAEIGADDTQGSITGSLSVPLPIGIPRQRPQIAPISASIALVDELGFVGDDGVFHAK